MFSQVSVCPQGWGVFIQGSGVSLSRGISVQGGVSIRETGTVTSVRYASYLNAFLFLFNSTLKSVRSLAGLRTILSIYIERKRKRHRKSVIACGNLHRIFLYRQLRVNLHWTNAKAIAIFTGQNEFGQGNIFTGVCLSTGGGCLLQIFGGCLLQIFGGEVAAPNFRGGCLLQIFGGGCLLQNFGGVPAPKFRGGLQFSEYGQRSAGTHPTGMHSFLSLSLPNIKSTLTGIRIHQKVSIFCDRFRLV